MWCYRSQKHSCPYSQLRRLTADSEGRSVTRKERWFRDNKNPFLLPWAGTTTLPSLKIKPSSQVTKWGARSERVDEKNKRTNTPSPSLSLSLHYNFNRHTAFFFLLQCINRHTALCSLRTAHSFCTQFTQFCTQFVITVAHSSGAHSSSAPFSCLH